VIKDLHKATHDNDYVEWNNEDLGSNNYNSGLGRNYHNVRT